MKSAPHQDLILYKYYPPQRSHILRDRCVFFSHATRFNDPFELEPHVEAVTTPDIALQVAQDYWRSDPKVNVAETVAFLQSERRKREEIDKLKQNLVILSLAEKPDSLLMWAHYASSHTGFVLGFNMSKESFMRRAGKRPRQLAKVRYSTHRPSVAMLSDLREEDMRLTKSVDWMHEQEWRVFESPLNADGEAVDPQATCWPFHFEPEVIDSVVLGARIETHTEKEIRTALAGPGYEHVKLLRCSINPQQFRLDLRSEDVHS